MRIQIQCPRYCAATHNQAWLVVGLVAKGCYGYGTVPEVVMVPRRVTFCVKTLIPTSVLGLFVMLITNPASILRYAIVLSLLPCLFIAKIDFCMLQIQIRIPRVLQAYLRC